MLFVFTYLWASEGLGAPDGTPARASYLNSSVYLGDHRLSRSQQRDARAFADVFS